jgi:hypothetical protein
MGTASSKCPELQGVSRWHGACSYHRGDMGVCKPSFLTRRAPSGLRARLLLLVFFAVVPSFGLILYTAWDARRAAAIELQAHLLRSTRLVATDQERLVEGVRHLLVGLAQLREVRDRHGETCSATAADLLRQDPNYANLAAAAPDGSLFCSGLPVTRPINVSDRAYFRRALETRGFVAGDYQIDRATLKPTINFAYPVSIGAPSFGPCSSPPWTSPGSTRVKSSPAWGPCSRGSPMS